MLVLIVLIVFVVDLNIADCNFPFTSLQIYLDASHVIFEYLNDIIFNLWFLPIFSQALSFILT